MYCDTACIAFALHASASSGSAGDDAVVVSAQVAVVTVMVEQFFEITLLHALHPTKMGFFQRIQEYTRAVSALPLPDDLSC